MPSSTPFCSSAEAPGTPFGAFVHAALVQAINVATLIAVFQALGPPVPFNIAVGSYVIGAVLMIVSVTPSGIGIIEAAMTFHLASQGLPLEMAAAATCYSGCSHSGCQRWQGSPAFRSQAEKPSSRTQSIELIELRADPRLTGLRGWFAGVRNAHARPRPARYSTPLHRRGLRPAQAPVPQPPRDSGRAGRDDDAHAAGTE